MQLQTLLHFHVLFWCGILWFHDFIRSFYYQCLSATFFIFLRFLDVLCSDLFCYYYWTKREANFEKLRRDNCVRTECLNLKSWKRQLCQNWMFEFEIVEETTVSELNVWIWNRGRDNCVRTECLNLKSWKRQLCQNWMFEFEIVEVKRNGLINSANIKLLILCFKCWPSAVWCCLILMFFCLVWYVPTSSSFTYLYHLCWWNIFFPLFSFWSFCLFCTNFLMQT